MEITGAWEYPLGGIQGWIAPTFIFSGSGGENEKVKCPSSDWPVAKRRDGTNILVSASGGKLAGTEDWLLFIDLVGRTH